MLTYTISFIKGCSYSFLFGLIIWSFQVCFNSWCYCVNSSLVNWLFIRDYLSFVMIFLTVIIMWLFIVMGLSNLALYISMFSAIIVYIVNNALIFWFFYELSIICALYMLLKESLYPERYNASWYMGGYVLLSSVPLLICILIVGLVEGSFNILAWDNNSINLSLVYVVMIIMFCTKIPLIPFHSWLPMVHAEASSPTSIILSGYIMKLGLVGVVRLCGSWVWGLGINSVSEFIFLLSLGFLIWAYYEVDSKRWLAVLSLSHIMVSVILLVYGCYDVNLLAYIFCLGHGYSVCGMFLLIWWGYNHVNSRSWLILTKFYSLVPVIQVLCVLMFMSVSSFPPTLQFFSEVILAWCSLAVNNDILTFIICIYLFGSSLVGLMVLGLVLIYLLDYSSIIHYNNSNSLGVSIIYIGILMLFTFIVV
uniref:NADH-ubiquinone oxidoreductase chain 4 n=1 Tax=Schistosoma haematobium TaxID=6185 RepID=A0A516EZW5_SCHHA|nr:NADH dehydrogenase subunit 4 [Schistosoma haematobium]QDO72053.1 NADH dehydrogenase subunit 4 [Schistosoma haematobium]